MRRFRLAATVSLMFLLLVTSPTSAQAEHGFKLGFKLLSDQIPNIAGQPLEDEHYGPNGDSLQQTTTGLMVWRKADNWTAFTDGARTWVNGPFGVMERGNDDRFEWEAAEAPSLESPPPMPKASGLVATPGLASDNFLVVRSITYTNTSDYWFVEVTDFRESRQFSGYLQTLSRKDELPATRIAPGESLIWQDAMSTSEFGMLSGTTTAYGWNTSLRFRWVSPDASQQSGLFVRSISWH